MSAKLIAPDAAYMESYLAACRTFREKNTSLYSLSDPDTYAQWKDTLLPMLEDQRLGINLKPGYVPSSTFWLIEDEEFIGVGNIRHSLTEPLLEFGGHIGYAVRPERWRQGYGTLLLALLLHEAAKLGIERALVTCDEANLGSAGVIEKNGGVLQDIADVVVEGKARSTKRYWVDTPLIKNRYLNTARLYDLDQRDNLTLDIPFYKEYAKQQSGAVLELACGTGRVALELAKDGREVTGLDLSEPMLAVFREKLLETPPEVRERVRLVHGNMASFSLGKEFSLIITPFRAFQALTEEDDIRGCLRCVREHLADGGLFILNAFRPYKVLDDSWCYPDAVQWERNDDLTHCNVVKLHRGERIDGVRQIIYPAFTYVVTRPGGEVVRYHEKLELRYYYYEQLRGLLLQSGFAIAEEYGWYDKSGIQDNRELIFVCR